MGDKAWCGKGGLKRGIWSAWEDKILINYIKVHGEGKWRDLPGRAGLKRCGKSCRLRWMNYLRPDIKRGNISEEEEDLIIKLQKLLGNRWSLIAGRLPGRTDNEIKNYWNNYLRKRFEDKNSTTSTSNSQKKKFEGTPEAGNSSDRLFRTKAVRCSKVIMMPQPLDYKNKVNIESASSSRIQEYNFKDIC